MAGFRTAFFLVFTGVATAFLLPKLPHSKPDFGFVEIGHGFFVMRHEITIGQWRACYDDGGCRFEPPSGMGAIGDDFPVTGIGVLDAQEFVAWAKNKTGSNLRLPTLKEWYAFSGVSPFRPKTVFTDPRLSWAATYGAEGKMDPTLRASGSFGATPNGLEDVKGNVWEWTSTCTANVELERCPAFYAAGEHESRVPIFVRDPSAGGCATGTPPAHLGFRLVLETNQSKTL